MNSKSISRAVCWYDVSNHQHETFIIFLLASLRVFCKTLKPKSEPEFFWYLTDLILKSAIDRMWLEQIVLSTLDSRRTVSYSGAKTRKVFYWEDHLTEWWQLKSSSVISPTNTDTVNFKCWLESLFSAWQISCHRWLSFNSVTTISLAYACLWDLQWYVNAPSYVTCPPRTNPSLKTLLQATMLSSNLNLIRHWASPRDQGLLVGVSMGGMSIANALINPIAATTCYYGGWHSIFYFAGNSDIQLPTK